jgi:hypothetical protein
LPFRDLIRGSGVGCLGGGLAGLMLTILYFALLHDGTTLYGMPAAFPLFALIGSLVGLVTGPVVFWIERQGGRVGMRRSGLLGAFGAFLIGAALDIAGGIITGRWSQVGFWTLALPTLIGGSAASAGLFAKARRKRLSWSGKER